MLKTFVTASALVALLAAAPAVAQDAAQPAAPTTNDQLLKKPAQPTTGMSSDQATTPSGASQAAAPADTAKPATMEANKPADTANPAMAEANNPATTPYKFIAQQEDGQLLASSIMGQTVYDGSGNNLGSVNDIVVDRDSKIVAVIIGVGGFLGIGQKNVAVSMAALAQSTDENGKLKLTLNATKDELDQAPPFTTLADLKAKELQPLKAEPTDGSLAPAPSTSPANPSNTQ